MDRREFIKTVPALAAGTTLALKAETPHNYPKGTDYLKLRYPYFVNCYIQNQKYWPLEEYKGGIFGGSHKGIKAEGYMGEKWINGQLRFYGFGEAVDFIEVHSQIIDLPKSLEQDFMGELAYEVFHERSQDPFVAPKHIFNYWVKCSPLKGVIEENKWIHPDYIDHTADGALIEHGK